MPFPAPLCTSGIDDPDDPTGTVTSDAVNGPMGFAFVSVVVFAGP